MKRVVIKITRDAPGWMASVAVDGEQYAAAYTPSYEQALREGYNYSLGLAAEAVTS